MGSFMGLFAEENDWIDINKHDVKYYQEMNLIKLSIKKFFGIMIPIAFGLFCH